MAEGSAGDKALGFGLLPDFGGREAIAKVGKIEAREFFPMEVHSLVPSGSFTIVSDERQIERGVGYPDEIAEEKDRLAAPPMADQPLHARLRVVRETFLGVFCG